MRRILKAYPGASEYHRLLLATARISMAALAFLAFGEAVAYSPWLGQPPPFGIDLISAGPMWIVWPSLWAVAGVWSVVTLIKGQGSGAIWVACMCVAWAFGFWLAFAMSFTDGPPSRDYLGGVIYTTFAVLLFAGRYLARGLLILSHTPVIEARADN